ncbi:hypothetical protein MRX96_028440 [Rhipicephalus microplus]
MRMPGDCFSPELFTKMAKKIAQLTKVVYTLNSRAEDQETLMLAMKQLHEEDMKRVTRDANDKMVRCQNQVCRQVALLEGALVRERLERFRLEGELRGHRHQQQLEPAGQLVSLCAEMREASVLLRSKLDAFDRLQLHVALAMEGLPANPDPPGMTSSVIVHGQVENDCILRKNDFLRDHCDKLAEENRRMRVNFEGDLAQLRSFYEEKLHSSRRLQLANDASLHASRVDALLLELAHSEQQLDRYCKEARALSDELEKRDKSLKVMDDQASGSQQALLQLTGRLKQSEAALNQLKMSCALYKQESIAKRGTYFFNFATMLAHYVFTVGTRPGSQRGEPTASPHGRNHRDVATWTSQDGGDPPVSYVSSRPWRRQERARVGVAPAHLYRPFQGRTVEDADRRANGACLPVPAGTRFCECGAVVIHNSHELGKLHRHRTQATQPSSRESSQERSGAAVRAMLARAAQEADFAQWLLRVASGHASSESPPAPLSITATVERGAAGPGETLVAAALTPEVASMTLEADRIASLEATSREQQARIEHLEAEVLQVAPTLARCEAQQKKLADTQEILESTKKELQAKQQKLEDLERRLNSCRDECKCLKLIQAQVKESLSEAEHKIYVLHSELDQKAEALSKKDQEIRSLQISIKDVKWELAEVLQEKEAKLSNSRKVLERSFRKMNAAWECKFK